MDTCRSAVVDGPHHNRRAQQRRNEKILDSGNVWSLLGRDSSPNSRSVSPQRENCETKNGYVLFQRKGGRVGQDSSPLRECILQDADVLRSTIPRKGNHYTLDHNVPGIASHTLGRRGGLRPQDSSSTRMCMSLEAETGHESARSSSTMGSRGRGNSAANAPAHVAVLADEEIMFGLRRRRRPSTRAHLERMRDSSLTKERMRQDHVGSGESAVKREAVQKEMEDCGVYRRGGRQPRDSSRTRDSLYHDRANDVRYAATRKDDLVAVDLAKGVKRKTKAGDVLHGESDNWAPWSRSPGRQSSNSSRLQSYSPGRGAVVTVDQVDWPNLPKPRRALAEQRGTRSGAAGRREQTPDGRAVGSGRALSARPLYSETSPFPSARTDDSDVVGRELRFGGGRRVFSSQNLYMQASTNCAVGDGASTNTVSPRRSSPRSERCSPRPTSSRSAERDGGSVRNYRPSRDLGPTPAAISPITGSSPAMASRGKRELVQVPAGKSSYDQSFSVACPISPQQTPPCEVAPPAEFDLHNLMQRQHTNEPMAPSDLWMRWDQRSASSRSNSARRWHRAPGTPPPPEVTPQVARAARLGNWYAHPLPRKEQVLSSRPPRSLSPPRPDVDLVR